MTTNNQQPSIPEEELIHWQNKSYEALCRFDDNPITVNMLFEKGYIEGRKDEYLLREGEGKDWKGFAKWVVANGWSIPNSNTEYRDLWSKGHDWPTTLYTSEELYELYRSDRSPY